MSTYEVSEFLIPPVSGDPIESDRLWSASPWSSSLWGTFEVLPDPLWGNRNKSFETEVVKLVNDHRSTKSLPLLTSQNQLDSCAGWKSLHMTNYNYMDHGDPAPPISRSTAQRFSDFGYDASWGENIAYGYDSPASVMSGWLSSPGHRANIENSQYRGIGVGAALKLGNRWAWTQCFGVKGENPPPPPDPDPSPLLKLTFSNRHAIGVYWAVTDIPAERVAVYVLSSLNWIKVREQGNTGDTFITYPLDFSGIARVRIVGGGVTIEGSFTVKRVKVI